jgi:hypothetical protein
MDGWIYIYYIETSNKTKGGERMRRRDFSLLLLFIDIQNHRGDLFIFFLGGKE